MKSSLNEEVSYIYSDLFTGTFWDSFQPYKLFVSQYLSYDDSLFLSKPFMNLLLAFTYR